MYPPHSSAERNIGGHPRAGANVKAFERVKGIFTDEDYSYMMGLLRTIGHCLEEFVYTGYGMELKHRNLESILEVCPNLTHLNLKGNVLKDIRRLKDLFQIQQCQLTSLNVSSAGNETQILSQLAVVLGDPSSRPLRYVAVSGAVDSIDVWEELESALRKNEILEYLHIDLAKREHREVLAQMQSEFETSTLSLRAKLAFLSAIQTHAKQGIPAAGDMIDSSSLRKFDAVIVAQVFAFAGKQMQQRTLFW